MSINKERKINKTRHYPCNCFHLQSIQAYRCNYENPQYYCRKHWCHSYDSCSYTRQYLWRKTPKVRKISTFNHHLHKGTRSTHTQKKTKDTKKTQLYLQRFDLHYNIKPSVYFSRIYEETKNKNMLLPVQLLPSPVYPGLQVQLWDPSVLLHTALMSQLWVLIIHSSVSRKESAQRSQKYNIYF